METESGELTIWVRRQWDDTQRQALYKLSAIENIHWDTTSGGVLAPTPYPFMHSYVWCNEMLDGELAHSCRHGEGPHRIKVCIVKKDNNHTPNNREAFARLLAMAGPKPMSQRVKMLSSPEALEWALEWARKNQKQR